MQNKTVVLSLTFIMSAIFNYMGMIALPFIMLIIVMTADYVTGMIKAYYHHKLSSKLGVKGFLKKVGYLFVLMVAIVIDFVIKMLLNNFGVDFNVGVIFGLLVALWLIVNELISILENIKSIGTPMPNIITKVLDRLKDNIEYTDIFSDSKEGGNDGNDNG